jgi:transcriptional regulator with XRE-family HTH domain
VQKAARAAKRVPLTPRETLALNVIRLRRERDWSQELLGAEAGLHRTFIAHVERQVRNPSLDSIEKIATAFGVQVWELLRPS